MPQTLRKKHQVLLDDSVRVRAYDRAIRALVKPGDIVADLGCGLGILSLLAARAGAARIHAVEVEPTTLKLARAEAKETGLSSRITFHEGMAQSTNVPERVDVVLTETLGSLGFDENILPLLHDARKYWLKPHGIVCPEALSVTLVPVCHHSAKRTLHPHAERIDPEAFLAKPDTSSKINFAKTRQKNFVTRTTFHIERSGTLTGFAGWFDVWLTEKVHFATGPGDPPTHWEQAFLPLREPLALREGQDIECILGIGPDDTCLESIIEYDFHIL